MSSSSRAGRFKKKLVSEENLLSEAPIIVDKLAPFLERRAQGIITEAQFTAVYLVIYLSTRFPFHWIGARQDTPVAASHELSITLGEMREAGIHFEESINRKLGPQTSLGELFNYYALKSTPRSVNRSIVEWSNNKYSLVLMNRIPTPLEVLDQQRQSKRCVTTLLKESQLSRYVLGERDPMSFTMHDLIHADHFFYDNHCYKGQMGFYKALWKASSEKVFDSALNNEAFRNEFEYVIADMNAYCVHLMKCLKSAILHYHEDGNEIFEKMLAVWNLTERTRTAFLRLNNVQFKTHEDTVEIQNFFDLNAPF